ncbi:MAG TPA: dTMP kinase [Kofleriaceae bacterium]|nr:dTMP kinase [Kofleriaceae bacterium]
MSRAALIVLEGIDGAGTTTQAARLVATLREDGIATHLTREPSDGPVGLLLRAILAGAHAPVDATTLSLLFAADRADHLHREVEPALARGDVVVSDRWYHSSLAYQGTGEERAWISQLNARARRPDLTIFLEVAPAVAAGRRADAGRSDEIFDALPLQERIAAGYQAVIAELRSRERIEVVDGERPPDEIATVVARLARETCQAVAAS